MKQEFLKELEPLIESIEPAGDGFAFRGKRYTVGQMAGAAQHAAPSLLNLMTQVLYTECYSKKIRYQSSSSDTIYTSPMIDTKQFVAQLSEQNQSTGLSDPGWLVTGLLAGGHIQVSKYGVSRVMLAEATKMPQVNDTVTFISRKEDGATQPGFYYVYSNAIFEYVPTTIRTYWNMEPEGAGLLISALTTQFNYYRIPFLFKCLSDPQHYSRRDSCVLYLQHKYLDQARKILRNINADISDFLQPDVPLFTFKQQDGVGVAESPIDGSSFGVSRMALVATGLLDAFSAGIKTPSEQITLIDKAFMNAGINPETPYLETGSSSCLLTNI